VISLWRSNSHVEVRGASRDLLTTLGRHLAVPVDAAERGSRFGGFFAEQGTEGKMELWGTLLRGNVAAAGLTPHLELLLRHYRQPYELRDARQRPSEQLPLWSLRQEPRVYQEYARKRLIEHGAGVVDAPPRCLAGDTLIGVQRNKKSYQTTIADLADRLLGPSAERLAVFARVLSRKETLRAIAKQTGWPLPTLVGWRRERKCLIKHHMKESETFVRFRDANGFIRLAPLTAVVRSGKKAVFRVTLLSGRFVEATAEHLFWTSEGWQPVSDLREGTLVCEEAPRIAKSSYDRGAGYPYKIGLRHHPFAGRLRHKRGGGFSVGWHRLAMEAFCNGLALDEYVARVSAGQIAGLRFIDPKKWHVHHKNENRRDFSIENLELLPAREHLRKHGREGGWKNVVFRTQFSPVVSVVPAGDKETFDLVMPEPHNFLANGIVTHNSGKTHLMSMALDTLNLRSLIVAPSVAIVRQTYGVLRETFGEDFVSRVDGEATDSERDLSKQFVIATTASAIRLPAEFFAKLDVLIVDEHHHSSADSWHRLNDLAAHAYYRFCFTGTHFRTGDDRLAMEALCSTVVCKISVDYLVRGGWLVPPRLVVSVPRAPRLSAKGWDDVYQQGIVECGPRNRMIAHVANTLVNSNVSVLVLTRRRQHAKELAAMIRDSALVRGGEAALTDESIAAFRSGKIPAIVGTTVVGEGVDLPNAGAVVYASGGGGSVQQVQGYFRPLTGFPGKQTGLIYDFKDRHHPLLSRHSDARVALAEQCLGVEAVRLW
jgi:superfamily II DNA or RNA helicase